MGLFVDETGRAGVDRFFVAEAFDCSPEFADDGRVALLFAARGDTSSSSPAPSLSVLEFMTVLVSGPCLVGNFASGGFFIAGLRCATRFLASFGVGVEAFLFLFSGTVLFFGEPAFRTGVGVGSGRRSDFGEGCPLSPSRRFGKGNSRFGGSKSWDLSVSSNMLGADRAQWRRSIVWLLVLGSRSTSIGGGFKGSSEGRAEKNGDAISRLLGR